MSEIPTRLARAIMYYYCTEQEASHPLEAPCAHLFMSGSSAPQLAQALGIPRKNAVTVSRSASIVSDVSFSVRELAPEDEASACEACRACSAALLSSASAAALACASALCGSSPSSCMASAPHGQAFLRVKAHRGQCIMHDPQLEEKPSVSLQPRPMALLIELEPLQRVQEAHLQADEFVNPCFNQWAMLHLIFSPPASCIPSTALAVALLPPVWTSMASTSRPSPSSSSLLRYFSTCISAIV